jgi:hypothetical protein
MLRAFLPICALQALSAGLLLADKTPPVPPPEPGYRNVPLKAHGEVVSYIRVKDTSTKMSDDSSDPFGFSKSSAMAHQSYDLGDTASSRDNADYQKSAEHTFVTQSYFASNSSAEMPGLHSAALTETAAPESSRHASGMDSTFYTAKADMGKPAEGMDTTSSYQGKSATLGGHKIDTFAAEGSDKTFTGREAQDVKRDLTALNEGLMGVKDLPSRPLTVDEVRALINHGIKPNTEEKPAEPSKALDDPDYTPDEAPAPLRAPAADEHHLRDLNDVGGDDAPPPPGMMAHPESDSSEPLPQ